MFKYMLHNYFSKILTKIKGEPFILDPNIPINYFLGIIFTNFETSLFLFMLTFAIMTPLGTFISDIFPALNQYYNEITAIVIGILFHISSTIIFESSEGHKFNIAKISMIILGIVLAYFM